MWVNGSFSETMFNSIINCKVALQVVAPFFSLITRNEYFCCYLCQYLLSWVIMEFSHSNRCIVYLLVVVICISLRTNNVLRKYILFSCVDLPSFLVKCLFMMTQGLLLCSAVWVPLRIPQAPYPCPSHKALHLHKVLWTFSPAALWWDCKALPSAIV